MSTDARDAERSRRAQERRGRITLRLGRVSDGEVDLHPVRGPEALTLVTQLTRESWSAAGLPIPDYPRHETPYRFVPRDDT